MKEKKPHLQRKIFGIPLLQPLLLSGVLLILFLIFAAMTWDRLNRQKDFVTQRLLEKGMSLIRTFEAGTRSGMFTMQWGLNKVQAILVETALQPEVAYMMITASDGTILVHSDTDQIGKIYTAMPMVQPIGPDPFFVQHRIRPRLSTGDVFEVYKQFVPIHERFKHHRRWRHRRMPYWTERPEQSRPPDQGPGDRSQTYPPREDGPPVDMPDLYIFAGLSMEKAQQAQTRLVRQTMASGAILFLLGCTAVVSLFVFGAYRTAKASLSRARAFTDKVIQHMPSGLLTLDAGYRVNTMNDTAREIFGGEIYEAFPELIDLIESMDESASSITREIVLTPLPDRELVLDVTAAPIREAEKGITGYVFLFRDLTQIRALKKTVETHRHMAAIGKLAAGVAHEIRNPLSSIKGFATYFEKRYEENDADRETAAIMVKEVERINRSISQLLEFAKPMAIDKQKTDLKKIIDHSLKLVQQDLSKKQIGVTVDIPPGRTEILTDGDRINQVLLNLYINAIEAMGENGALEIRMTDRPGAGMVEIQVNDDGGGIDETVQDRVFDPYFTTRSSGTGLGLSIVHRIVENLGGQIRFESKKGRGTRFFISLPRE